jgi:hypothetical protein
METGYGPGNVDLPWGASTITWAGGALFMLSGAQLATEALYDGLIWVAIASTVLIGVGLILVILGLDLLVNPFRHQALGVTIILVAVLAAVVMIVTFVVAPMGAVLLFVSPMSGILGGAWAILYESSEEDLRGAGSLGA